MSGHLYVRDGLGKVHTNLKTKHIYNIIIKNEHSCI
jgi:hypothetical protein